jgi:hypothetical protein
MDSVPAVKRDRYGGIGLPEQERSPMRGNGK